ncbi:hypothetical protein AAFF_G00376040 [Aldrovandia affinis]|uniref:Uncharacterized protein n=1 Tax=Aldrovandia affinis TaxID=143900 RepID=A0AAD7VYD6_9TELE|nr:hypothetical protein AAFF_G00376040 [Aldrovandia affinis]
MKLVMPVMSCVGGVVVVLDYCGFEDFVFSEFLCLLTESMFLRSVSEMLIKAAFPLKCYRLVFLNTNSTEDK